MTKLLALVLLAASAVLVTAGISDAAQNAVFGVEPSPGRANGAVRRSLDVPLAMTRARSEGVRVYNVTGRPVRIRVYAASASVKDGVVTIGTSSGNTGWPSSRIRVEPSVVSLPPHGQAVVGVRVAAGTFTSPGQMAAIVAEQAAGDVSGGIDLVQRIALLVRPSSEITETRTGPGPKAVVGWAAAALGAAALGSAVRRRRPPVRTAAAA